MRLTQPQNISLGNILTLTELYITGTAANLKPGDSLLFVFGDSSDQKAVRTVYETVEQVADDRTLVRLTHCLQEHTRLYPYSLRSSRS